MRKPSGVPCIISENGITTVTERWKMPVKWQAIAHCCFLFCFFLFLAIAHWTWQWMASWLSKLYFLHSFSTSWVEKVEVYGQTTSPALQISCVLHNDHCNEQLCLWNRVVSSVSLLRLLCTSETTKILCCHESNKKKTHLLYC